MKFKVKLPTTSWNFEFTWARLTYFDCKVIFSSKWRCGLGWSEMCFSILTKVDLSYVCWRNCVAHPKLQQFRYPSLFMRLCSNLAQRELTLFAAWRTERNSRIFRPFSHDLDIFNSRQFIVMTSIDQKISEVWFYYILASRETSKSCIISLVNLVITKFNFNWPYTHKWPFILNKDRRSNSPTLMLLILGAFPLPAGQPKFEITYTNCTLFTEVSHWPSCVI